MNLRSLAGRIGIALVRAAMPASAPPPTSILRAPRFPDPILVPHARDRWRSAQAASYTPAKIVSTLDGALRGLLHDQWRLFDLMEDTWPRLAKNLAELKASLEEQSWTVTPWAETAAEPTPEALDRKALVEEALWRMTPSPVANEGDFTDTLRDIADAWGKGVSVLEILWESRSWSSHRSGRLIAPRATQWIHPRYYGWDNTILPDRLRLNRLELAQSQALLDSHTSLTTPPGSLDSSLWLEFPPDKFIIAIAKAKTGHPTGAALLRPLAWWWCAANFTSEWLLNLAQLFGQPIRWATYPSGAPDALVSRIETMLDSMGSTAWAVMPEGAKLELKADAKAGADNPQVALLAIADKVCDLLMLGQTLTSDAADRGTQALGTVHERVLAGRQLAICNWAAKIVNTQLIPAILRQNYGDTRWLPYINIEPEQQDAKLLAERDQILSNMGLRFPEPWFYERHRVPIPEPGEPLIEGRAPAPPIPAPGFGPTQPSWGIVDEPGKPKVARAAAATNGEVAEAAVDELVRQAVASSVGARVRWLDPIRAELDRLVEAARNEKLDDQALAQFIDQAARNLPDLFAQLDVNALADSIEDALGAAVVSAAIKPLTPIP